MPFGDGTSAFWFYGRLSPASEVPPFFAEEVPISEHARIELIYEHLGIWSGPGSRDCKQPGEAAQISHLVVDAWALLAGQALEWSLEGWVEAIKAQFEGAIMGHVPGRRRPSSAEPDSPASRLARRAAELAVELRGNTRYRLALRDVNLGQRDTSDDAVLFAYRSVENGARALCDVDEVNWPEFHDRLGRDAAEGKALMEPLTKARAAAAHGELDPAQPMPGEAKGKLLLLARRLLVEALEADPTLACDSLDWVEDWHSLSESSDPHSHPARCDEPH